MTARWLLALACAAPLAAAGDGTGGEGGVDDALERLARAAEDDPGLSDDTRRALADLARELREERDRDAEALARTVEGYLAKTHGEPVAEPSRWTVSGDLRFRGEFTDHAARRDRDRLRVRFRVGATYAWSERVTIGARLVTGNPDDPNSSHQTFGTVLDDYEISLDRVFLAWRPRAVDGATITAGKAGLPIARNPVYGELVWDGDVQPEGATIAWGRNLAEDGARVDLVAGLVTLLEQAQGGDPYGLFGQAAARVPLRGDVTARAALGYTWWSDVSPGAAFSDNAGNAAVDTDADTVPDSFASAFGILDAVVAIEWTGWVRPVVVSAEYFVNTRAAIDADRGWALGLAVGRKRAKGDWLVYGQWQVVQQDAVFSVVSQDDFPFQTGFRGFVIGTRYLVADRAELHLWLLAAEPDGGGAGTDYRFRLDFTLGF